MPSPIARSVLSRCSSVLLCYARAVPLWAIALTVLFLGALRSRVAGAAVGWGAEGVTSNEVPSHDQGKKGIASGHLGDTQGARE